MTLILRMAPEIKPQRGANAGDLKGNFKGSPALLRSAGHPVPGFTKSSWLLTYDFGQPAHLI